VSAPLNPSLAPSLADTGAVDAENPWPGLASFREADRELFYGRERETEELFRLVLRERLTVLFGLSGLGKTSLLQAGVFPRLRDENVLPVPIRLDHSADAAPFPEQIAAAIARAAAAAGAEAPALRPGETLWELFHRQGNDFWSARNRPLVPLLAFDQFEEIFTLGRGRPGTAGLVGTLTSLAEGSPPAAVKARLDANPAEAKDFSFARHNYKILLSLREDFLPDLEALRKSIRTIGINRLRLCRMTGENALRVVLLPGRALLDADIAERAVRFVAGEEPGEEPAPLPELEIEPALLSIVCRELNNKRRARGEASITADLLEGNRTAILTDLYERSLDGLPPEVRTFIEERLLTVSGFRDSVALENALATPGVTREAVDRLTARRLLRIEDHGGGQRLELTHDVLTGVVRASRDSRRQREAEARAEIARREAEERERKVRRELRRSRRLLILFAVLLVGVGVLASYVYTLRGEAMRSLAASDVERAFNLEVDRPQEALACIADALRHDPESLSARSLLFDILLDRSWLLPVREARYSDSTEIAIAKDGHTAAVLTTAGQVRLLDLDTWRPLDPPLREESPIVSMELSADGRHLLTETGSAARLWDLRSRRAIGGPYPGQEDSISCLDAACGLLLHDLGETSRILDAATGRPVGPPIPTATLPRSRTTPDGVRILTLQADGMGRTVLVRDLRSGAVLGAPLQHRELVRNARISSDGRLIATVLSKSVQVWDAATHEPLAVLEHESGIDIGKFGSDEEDAGLIVTHSDDGATRVWDARSGMMLSRLELQADWMSADVKAGGKVLITITQERRVHLWDVRTGAPLAEPLQDISAAEPRGDHLVTASEDGVIRLLAPTGAGQSLLVDTPSDTFDSAALSADARLVATTESGTLSVRDTVTREKVGAALTGLGPAARLRFLAGDRRVAAILARRAAVWDFRAGRIVSETPLLPVWQSLDDVSPDGARAVTVTTPAYPPDLQLVDLATGRPVGARLPHRAKWKTPAPFSPDSRRLLVAPTESTIQVVDTRSGRPGVTLDPKGGRVLAAVFSADSHRVLTVTQDRTARVWDALTGRQLASVKSPHALASAAFTGKDRFLVTIAEDTRVRLWDAATGARVGEPLVTPAALAAELAPDGHRMLVLSDTTARLWETSTGRPLGNQVIPGGKILAARFTPDGNRLYAVSQENLSVSDVPLGAKDDAQLLARWADAVGGYVIERKGVLLPIEDPIGRLEALRKETAEAPLGEPAAPSLIRWFLSDPAKRPASPLAR
jgi:WD40 repeat protein